MICKNCGHKNITKACFCTHCAHPFTEEERAQAYGSTIYGKIERAEKLKGYLTLSAITSHPVFRIAVLVLILIWGLLAGRTHGNHLTILQNDAYTVSQNTETGDYYIVTEATRIDLGLYVPQQPESLHLEKRVGDTVEYETTFTAEEQLQVESSNEGYYLIKADYGDSEETIKLFVLSDKNA